jgi:hypothetical protein
MFLLNLQIQLRQKTALAIFGNDFRTPDSRWQTFGKAFRR